MLENEFDGLLECHFGMLSAMSEKLPYLNLMSLNDPVSEPASDGYGSILRELGGEEITVTVDLNYRSPCPICGEPDTDDSIGVRIENPSNPEMFVEGFAHPHCIEAITAT